MRGLTDATDYFVIASGTSDAHVRGIAESVIEKLGRRGHRTHHVEGLNGGRWVLLDFVDFVIHLFHPETRSFYQLERLWDDAPGAADQLHLARGRHASTRRPGAGPPAARLCPGLLSAQYFGRNKVQYTNFDFKIIQTEHFDVYFYERERVAAMDAARMAERCYARLSKVLNHEFRERKPIILYASHSDFQQTNATGQVAGEGTGGVTDFAAQPRGACRSPARTRTSSTCCMHEMAHQFQYDIWSRGRAGAGFPPSSPSTRRSGSPRAWPSTCRSARSMPRPRCGSGTRRWRASCPPSSR